MFHIENVTKYIMYLEEYSVNKFIFCMIRILFKYITSDF